MTILFARDGLTLDLSESGLAVLDIDVSDRSQNVMTRALLAALAAACDELKTTQARVLLIQSRKPGSFLAGADLHELAAVHTAAEALKISAEGQRVLNRLAGLPIPSVAVIRGPCLGGGLELALACDYRAAVEVPSTRLGLPEVELGLIPAWGGTHRLPALVGLERALAIVLGRQRLAARKAAEWGLVDMVLSEGTDSAEQIARATQPLWQRGKRGGWRRAGRTWRQRILESNPLGRALLFRGAAWMIRRRMPEEMPAPSEALQTIRAGLRGGFQAGLAREQEAIGRLAGTPACRNLVNLFLAIERARKPAGHSSAESEDTESAIRRLGVVGAGTMGTGITQLAVVKGLQVAIQEVDEQARQAAGARLGEWVQSAAEHGLLPEGQAGPSPTRIAVTTAWEGFDTADVVIEAASENLDTKRRIFQALEEHCPPASILASNTSSLSIGALQEVLKRPERVAGMHFFNPVQRMPLVEIVRGPQTGAGVADALTKVALALGKIPVLVKDAPGFVVNRVLVPYLNEAILLAAEGVPLERIDGTMRRFGMAAGPLDVLDQVGLDVASDIASSVAARQEERSLAQRVLEGMRQAGWLGRKTGLGFYAYVGGRKRRRREILSFLRSAAGLQATARAAPVPLGEVRERLVLATVNEAAQCLADGVAPSAEVVDLALVLGAGWAPHRGGPLRYADDTGLAAVVARLSELTRLYGSRFAPGDELRRRAAAGESFYGRPATLDPRGAAPARDG